MATSFGASFLPGADQQTPGITVPTAQQAIQFLSLHLPKVVGAQAPAPSALLNAPGGAASPDLASAVVRSVLRALGHDVPDTGGAPMPGGDLGGTPSPTPSLGPAPMGETGIPTPPTPLAPGGPSPMAGSRDPSEMAMLKLALSNLAGMGGAGGMTPRVQYTEDPTAQPERAPIPDDQGMGRVVPLPSFPGGKGTRGPVY